MDTKKTEWLSCSVEEWLVDHHGITAEELNSYSYKEIDNMLGALVINEIPLHLINSLVDAKYHYNYLAKGE